ncbi:hypothetical protein CU633_16325 [Bacillus sp. V3-13]|uniref:FtsX-like permease family protein n=1 Tax=Bacillus sp. V3-13 TaxID=2053728 RepID=UPI000C759E7C|nr:ABC transporter permease [Bacillus sp. V3-13]PLR76262.1 hypothetical protein CU633_16325 [Bacillus sp. V3-13]
MIKLTIDTLIHRKKWFFIIVLVIALSLTAIISIFSATHSIKSSLLFESYQKYGEHSGVLLEVDKAKDQLKTGSALVGEFAITASLPLEGNNQIATVGWMDETALKLGHLDLIKGRLPAKNNELAIEAYYLSKIDKEWEIGEKRTLTILDKPMEYTLVGIIHDYSAQWSAPIGVKKGINDFPNIFVRQQNNQTSNNYLVKLSGNIEKAEEKMNDLVYENNYRGFINDRLFYIGLIDYDTISVVSTIFQIIIFALSFICINSLFSYFYIDQQKKVGIYKAIGFTNVALLKMAFIQCFLTFICGIILSLPMIIGSHFLIIEFTYDQGLLNYSDMLPFFIICMVWLLALFILVYIEACRPILRNRGNSVIGLVRGFKFSQPQYDKLISNSRSFYVKQLLIQLFKSPAGMLRSILSLCLAILTIFFSNFLEKESVGIWDAQNDYHLVSQKAYAYKTINNFNVLKEKELAFSPKEVAGLAAAPGVKYIEKVPFMDDVHPVLNPEQLTPFFNSWIEEFQPIETEKRPLSFEKAKPGAKPLPNVKYVLVNKEEYDSIVNSYFKDRADYNNFENKVLMFIPNEINDKQFNELVNDNLTFIKLSQSVKSLTVKEWQFEIDNIITEPYRRYIDDSLTLENNGEITILLDERTAIKNNMLTGYKDIIVYLDESISNQDLEKVDLLTKELVAPIPGSLYQNISEFKKDDTKISSLVGVLGKLTFLISILFSSISIFLIIFGKFLIQKWQWGVYLSLGMSKKKVLYFLNYEGIVYFSVALLISTLVISVSVVFFGFVHPISYYLAHFFLAVTIILMTILLNGLVLKKNIDKKTILDLLRVAD